MHDFGDVRALLQRAQRPSWAMWVELCELCEDWPSEDTFEHVVRPYVHAHTSRWDWDESLMAAPRSWVERIARGDGAPVGARLLKKLDLYDRGVDGGAMHAALAGGHLLHLRQLDLSQNALGNAGASALGAHSAQLDALRRIDLSGNAIEGGGWHALCQGEGWAGLDELRARGNPLGQELEPSPFAGAIAPRILVLDESHLPGETAAWAISRLDTSRLEDVRVSRCSIDATGFEALIDALAHAPLRRLEISGNRIGVDGVLALRQAPWLSKLEHLRAREIGPSREAMRALARDPRASSQVRNEAAYAARGRYW